VEILKNWAWLLAWTCERYARGICRLRRLRHAKGLSQDDLAYEAEVSRSYLSQLEKGAFFASLRIVGRLAIALDVEPAELLKTSRKSKGPRSAELEQLRHMEGGPAAESAHEQKRPR
jgi:transcriptional regulator with XRE-family HTH domain